MRFTVEEPRARKLIAVEKAARRVRETHYHKVAAEKLVYTASGWVTDHYIWDDIQEFWRADATHARALQALVDAQERDFSVNPCAEVLPR